MVTSARPQQTDRPPAGNLNLPLPLAGAAAGGGAVALLFLVMPAGLLEGAVTASGIPAVLAAAEPPLGFTARIALALVFGGLVAGFAWFGLGMIAGRRTIDVAGMSRWLQRIPADPAAAPRAPLYANRDLGTPFLDVRAPVHLEPVEREVPIDLDQPLAAFDPGAMRAVSLAPPEPVAPLARPQLIDPGDRFETFELTPVRREWAVAPAPAAEPAAPIARPSLRAPSSDTPRATPLRETGLRAAPPGPPAPPAPPPPLTVAPETESSVHALLARLERGISNLPPDPAEPAIRVGSLEDTLGDLRRLATGTR